MRLNNKIMLAAVLAMVSFDAGAQSVPVGSMIDGLLRREQLLGKLDSSVSLFIRPVFYPAPVTASGNADSTRTGSEVRNNIGKVTSRGKASFGLLPVAWTQQYNARAPYGWNDGPMIPARGYQTMLTGGLYASYGPLSLQLKPEYVFAENKAYEGFPIYADEFRSGVYYGMYNHLDVPERFGNGSYSKLSWGQSSIRFTVRPVSVALSNENLWWGPGQRNSLLMSNNAAGFKHLSLSTVKPVRTIIGSFEAQVIAGRLEGSGFTPPGTDMTYAGTLLYNPKNDDWRYLSGIIAVYTPKWVPGLFLGIARTFMVYHDEIGNGVADYLPFLSPLQKKNVGEEDNKGRDQQSSVYARWFFKEVGAEMYVEYGRTDHAYNLRDLTVQPAHSSAYVFGISKVLAINNAPKQHLLVNVEITEMRSTKSNVIREGGIWYVHDRVRHGYTNRGEIIGAGIGTGGGLVSAGLNWFSGLKTIGLSVERYEHNADFYYFAFDDRIPEHRWIDQSIQAFSTWDYRGLVFSAKLQAIKSNNYQWYVDPADPDQGNIKYNFHSEVGILYRF
ncbi:capsule assembly Wzi family protein [Hufsiella ginkgonis]|uniref:Capsule assembly Wzi family protein n=1 Tax=Hufsiella ginkgonis TaxID=2695274 RepID=A0A7K1Y0R5_9SPHI|nr:capsule assembly Wzi family protein [Hufsiella ginkgonis]MXV16687.1 hypothetical protein [Hufsiella ginkgonis]